MRRSRRPSTTPLGPARLIGRRQGKWQRHHDVVLPPGSFPSGTVKVVVAFHGYTPLKSGSEMGVPVTRQTWHLDNFKVKVYRLAQGF
ncbi:MAG: hypothetical protein ABI862_04480 [Ilumatobacteraceae bacterium]